VYSIYRKNRSVNIIYQELQIYPETL